MGNTYNSEEIDWEKLYRKLYVHTDNLLKAFEWFRGSESSSYRKGKEIHDYVSYAIEKYLRNPEKYDPTTGRSLFNYIKHHILRTLIGNDARSPENKRSIDPRKSENANQNEDGDEIDYTETKLLGYTDAFFDLEIDYNNIMSYIESELKGEKILEDIFLGVTFSYERRDTIKEFNLSEKEYDNGMRRLITIFKQASKKFNLKNYKKT